MLESGFARPRLYIEEPCRNWGRLLWDGGLMISSNLNYIQVPGGLNDLSGMNFVDGYTLGPQATFGHFMSDNSRWEVYENVRWAFSRRALMGKGALRWYSPVDRSAMVELYGGQFTEDFDSSPILSTFMQEFAAVVCAWNHCKLLERTNAGMRTSFLLSNDLKLNLDAGWERRRSMTNHRRTNSFGAHPQTNDPLIRDDQSAKELQDYQGPIDGELGYLGLQLTYCPKAKHVIYDAMTSQMTTSYPTWNLNVDLGAGSWHFASVGLDLSQQISLGTGVNRISYFLSGGGILKHGELGLADWHHFDASTFFWQNSRSVSRFAMLEPYELSTDKYWAEGHVEWSSGNLFLSRFAKQPGELDEYVQMHVAKVPGHRAYCEMQYGIDLMQMMRFGVAIGFDNLTCRGAAFTMSLDVFKAKKGKKGVVGIVQI